MTVWECARTGQRCSPKPTSSEALNARLTRFSQHTSAAIVAYKHDGEVPHDLRCPITQEALVHPVRIGTTGRHLYSEEAIVEWAWRQPVDPMTRKSLRGEVLLREPAATAAINALRRGAADLYLKEGDVQQAQALHQEADTCEAVDAQRPVAAPERVNWHTVYTSLRVAGGALVGAQLGLSGYLWAIGHDPGVAQQLSQAANTAYLIAAVLEAHPRTQLIAMGTSVAATAALRYVVPTSASLLGLAIGLAIA